MAATVTAQGSWFTKITAITLAKSANETVAHALPTTPNLLAIYVVGSAGTVTLQGTIGAVTVDATNIVFTNIGEDKINGVCTAGFLHSLIT